MAFDSPFVTQSNSPSHIVVANATPNAELADAESYRASDNSEPINAVAALAGDDKVRAERRAG